MAVTWNIPNLLLSQSLLDRDTTSLCTDKWVDAIDVLRAKYATLVAKHDCRFTSEVTLPTQDKTTAQYNYTAAQSL